MKYECQYCFEMFKEPRQKIVGRGPLNADNNTASDTDTQPVCPYCGDTVLMPVGDYEE